MENIETNLNQILEDYNANDDFKNTNIQFINLIEKSKQNVAVIKAYLHFVYPLRNQDEKMNKNCITLCEEIIKNNNLLEPKDMQKLDAIYGEIEDYENEVKYYLEAEKHIERKTRNEYANIAWYYHEIAENYPKTIEYYKKYLEHNRVWFSDNKEKTIALIKELENKLK